MKYTRKDAQFASRNLFKKQINDLAFRQIRQQTGLRMSRRDYMDLKLLLKVDD